jgi:uncharacterized phiE125 gp8 family phage protein
MSLHLIVPPVHLPLGLAEMRAHLHLQDIEGSDIDAELMAFLRAAVAHIDGAAGWLGRQLINATWELKLNCFAWPIIVPLPPLQSVISIKYRDDQGVEQTLASNLYQVAGIGSLGPAKIWPAYGQRWPATRAMPEAVTVRFVAGFGPDWNAVPESIRAALLLMVATSYNYRESVMPTEFMFTPAATNLLVPYRVW